MKTSSPLEGPADAMLYTTYWEPPVSWTPAGFPKLCLSSISAKQVSEVPLTYLCFNMECHQNTAVM